MDSYYLACFYLIIFYFIDAVVTLSRPPQLECLSDAMRLHFVPEGYPFIGHVYVKGFFYSSRCHLDYTQYSIAAPFFFHLPYRSDCQIKRERLQDPRGISYSVVVVVQHHRLFVTAADKAYSVSCFYRDFQPRLEQTLEIGDLTTQVIRESDGTPTCSYEVLQGSSQGPPAKYANIGDVLVHKFSCDSAAMGILVHSCFVRDGIGNEFALVNDRGCSTDTSLVIPLVYNDDLTSASTPIAAFKFADQMIVYFTCQVTLCNKANNGCEGITVGCLLKTKITIPLKPPYCQYLPLPNEDGGHSMPVVDQRPEPYAPSSTTVQVNQTEASTTSYPYVTETMEPSDGITGTVSSNSTEEVASQLTTETITRPPVSLTNEDNYSGAHMPSLVPPEDFSANVDAGYSGGNYANGAYYGSGDNPYIGSNANIFNGQTSTQIPIEPNPEPLGPATTIFHAGFAASRHARSNPKKEDKPNSTDGKITVGVTADQLIIFGKDEKEPKVGEEEKRKAEEISAESGETQNENSDCEKVDEPVWLAICIGTVLIATLLLFLQAQHYRKRFQKLGNKSTFNPPYELISVVPGTKF
ncbi:hypothetical protein FO519_001641 [Halicephalobus sp. NKZ332]|nr:hypothetical protein FO519_001641 [Halicephalobus sp. NKZ332]